jgi:hypothetical protein
MLLALICVKALGLHGPSPNKKGEVARNKSHLKGIAMAATLDLSSETPQFFPNGQEQLRV